MVMEKNWNSFNKYGGTSAKIYLLKVNDRKSKKRCEICSQLTIKTSEQRH